jgi:hypothetical protein
MYESNTSSAVGVMLPGGAACGFFGRGYPGFEQLAAD